MKLKQRNLVAKHAQRSGAGKHKEKTMRDYNYDDFNNRDSVCLENHYSEVQYLEDRVTDLENQVKALSDDEVFILSEIMLVRDQYSDYEDIHEELTHIINFHSEDVKKLAIKKIKDKFPERHWGPF